MRHHIITRINVENDWINVRGCGRVRDRMALKRFDREYLEHRLELFERFTVPSIAGQTDQKFYWEVLIHPDTDKDLIEKFTVATKKAPRGRVRILKRDRDIGRLLRVKAWGTTTNLDSDDAISCDFVESIKKVVTEEPERAYAVSFDCGYHFSLRSNQAVARRSPTNAYNTLVEPCTLPLTICALPHGNVEQYFKVIHIKGPPMWLQVVHDLNIENHKIRHSKKSVDIQVPEIQKRFKIYDR